MSYSLLALSKVLTSESLVMKKLSGSRKLLNFLKKLPFKVNTFKVNFLGPECIPKSNTENIWIQAQSIIQFLMDDYNNARCHSKWRWLLSAQMRRPIRLRKSKELIISWSWQEEISILHLLRHSTSPDSCQSTTHDWVTNTGNGTWYSSKWISKVLSCKKNSKNWVLKHQRVCKETKLPFKKQENKIEVSYFLA